MPGAMYDIGRSKRAQRAYSLDDVAIVPSRRTRGMDQVNLTWRIDAVDFDFPIIAAPMDSIMSPRTAIEVGRLGGLGVLNLEGLWTRYENPEPILEEITAITDGVEATRRMQQVYAEPIKAELITERMREIRTPVCRWPVHSARRTPRSSPRSSRGPESTSSSSVAPR